MFLFHQGILTAEEYDLCMERLGQKMEIKWRKTEGQD